MSEFNSNNFKQSPRISEVITDAPRTSGGAPTPELHEPTPPQKEKWSNKRKAFTFGGAGLTLLLAGTLAVGLNSGQKTQGEAPSKGTETSAPSNPGETTAPTTTPETSTSFETVVIPLDATSDQIGISVTKIINAQLAGNLTPATNDAIVNDISGATADELNHKIATDNVTGIFDAQYVTGWEKDDNLKGVFTFTVDRNADRIFNYTSGQSLTDSFDYTSANIISSSATETVIDVTFVENYADPQDPTDTQKYNGKSATERFTLVPQGDRLVISNQVLNP